MKCRACWADKAYVRQARGWREIAMTWLGFVPLKCQHCYHKFAVLRPLTIGQQLTPPVRKTSPVRQESGGLACGQHGEIAPSATATAR
jgi:hypothetical protein